MACKKNRLLAKGKYSLYCLKFFREGVLWNLKKQMSWKML